MAPKTAPDIFNSDVDQTGSYLYTTNEMLSNRVASARKSRAMLETISYRGKRVLDIGCGDGTYTVELFDHGAPNFLVGIDPAEKAIEAAKRKAQGRAFSLQVGSAYELPFADASFDIGHLRDVLHHMEHPVQALREALRVACAIVVTEPNGYNLILKLRERFSPYHVEHAEKSYAPHALDQWIQELGGTTRVRGWFGLVPFFWPDWTVAPLKALEPIVEGTPGLRSLGCASYVFVSENKTVS